MCEPLKGNGLRLNKDLILEEIGFFDKGLDRIPMLFKTESLMSAVKGLIEYHEDLIEAKIKLLQECYESTSAGEAQCFYVIEKEYESINAIELWLEDAV